MHTKKTKYFTHRSAWLLSMLLFLAACTDNFDQLNTPDDQIVAENVDATLLGQAFAQSQYRAMKGPAGPFQLAQSLFADLYAQYFATTAENFDSDQYLEVGRWIDGVWTDFYGNAAPQIQFVEEFSAENGLDVQNAIAKVWRVQSYHRMTDYWGPIIYSEFGNGETTVPYDRQEDIYMDFFTTLDEAVEVLKQNAGGNAFGSNDQIYEGNVDQWLKFANSLRLRLAMRISYIDEGKAKIEAEKAIDDGVITDNADNAEIITTENSRNPYTTITDWGEFRMSSAMESTLEGYEDPRIGVFFSPANFGDDDGDGLPYEGMRNGLPRTQKPGDLNDTYSDMGVDWLNDNRGGSNPPIKVLRAAEVYFLRAEGALNGWDMGGSAQQLYEDGIRMSLLEYGADESEINAYISSTNTPISPDDEWGSAPMSDVPIAWDPLGDFERNQEQIITQKWIALYPDSWEAFAEYRRTGYPTLYPIIESVNEHLEEDDIFRRMTFVDSEFSNNPEAVQDAIDLIENGPDQNDTRLWWDAKPIN